MTKLKESASQSASAREAERVKQARKQAEEDLAGSTTETGFTDQGGSRSSQATQKARRGEPLTAASSKERSPKQENL